MKNGVETLSKIGGKIYSVIAWIGFAVIVIPIFFVFIPVVLAGYSSVPYESSSITNEQKNEILSLLNIENKDYIEPEYFYTVGIQIEPQTAFQFKVPRENDADFLGSLSNSYKPGEEYVPNNMFSIETKKDAVYTKETFIPINNGDARSEALFRLDSDEYDGVIYRYSGTKTPDSLWPVFRLFPLDPLPVLMIYFVVLIGAAVFIAIKIYKNKKKQPA